MLASEKRPMYGPWPTAPVSASRTRVPETSRWMARNFAAAAMSMVTWKPSGLATNMGSVNPESNRQLVVGAFVVLEEVGLRGRRRAGFDGGGRRADDRSAGTAQHRFDARQPPVGLADGVGGTL